MLSTLENNTKTRTALTLPTDHTNSLATGLLPTEETQGLQYDLHAADFLDHFSLRIKLDTLQKRTFRKMGNLKGDFILLPSRW